MRVGIVSDVHANLPALRAALGALRAERVDTLVCPGDLVGYGPMPNECVEVLSEAGAICVAGNHDLIVLGRLDTDRCVPAARETLAWTTSVLTPSARAFLAALPPSAVVGEQLVIAHGSLQDPQAYVRTAQVPGQLRALEEEHPRARALVLGHTHEPGGWDATGRPLVAGAEVALPAPRCVVNPGAVGQSRTHPLREPRVLARFMVVDFGRGTLSWRGVPYATWPVRRALRRAGLPGGTYRMATSLPRALRARLARRPS